MIARMHQGGFGGRCHRSPSSPLMNSFSRVDLDIFTLAWRIESGVSLRLLWHVPFSQQKLLAVLVLGYTVSEFCHR